MSKVRAQQKADRIKFSLFVVVALAITAYLVIVTGEIRMGSREEYRAVFTNISGLRAGDQVRVASVPVGRVKQIQVRDDNTVLVTFDVKDDIELNTSTTATVRYRNLIGDRFLALDRPKEAAPVLRAGGTISLDRTSSALDLDTLLNGFKPLFVGLNPAQINDLSTQIVQVLQGQTSAISTLLTTVGRVTQTIGDRQGLIRQVVDNLDTVLATVDDRRDVLGTLIDELSDLVGGLDRQDSKILTAAGDISGFAQSAAALLAQVRGDLTPTLRQLALAAGEVNQKATTLDQVLERFPSHYQTVQQSASYGNFFNFFLCGIRLQLTDDNGAPVQTPWIRSDLQRCTR
jgi:phospholipid/cholesterol/gamma-HCH transport system substrate-binding protein